MGQRIKLPEPVTEHRNNRIGESLIGEFAMIYRITILLAALGFTIPAYAAGLQTWQFKGTCEESKIAKSDGIQVGPTSRETTSGVKSGKYWEDGLLWEIKPLSCDTAVVVLKGDTEGYAAAAFLNAGKPAKILFGFAGNAAKNPFFSADSVSLEGQKPISLIPDGTHGCHFYFTGGGSFTLGWQTRLDRIKCDSKWSSQDGHLTNIVVTFTTLKVYKPGPGEIRLPVLPNSLDGRLIGAPEDAFLQVWKPIESDTGEVSYINMKSIERGAAGMQVWIYTSVPNTIFDIDKLRVLAFECKGHVMPFDDEGMTKWMDAPPRSVVGAIANIVCAGDQSTPGRYRQ
jgi:hypothetical protein